MRIQLRWIFIICLLVIPFMGTKIYQKYRPLADWEQSAEGLVVHIRDDGTERVIRFDEYASGVLAAIMDPEVHDETLKVMSVVLRTLVSRNSKDNRMAEENLLGLPWLSAGERLAKDVDEERIKRAVSETSGCKILYMGEEILPLFFEISSGKTRDFSNVWNENVDYLRSVDSPWDKGAAAYISKTFLSGKKIMRLLSETESFGEGIDALSEKDLQVVEKDASGYVLQIQACGKTWSGEAFRCLLGLPSACFEYNAKRNGLEFTCYGRGHGVGLSVYGADAMAKEGKTWQEILEWYYPGTEVK